MKQEIIEMARQAGIKCRKYVFYSEFCDGVYADDLEAFAKLVAEKSIQPYLPYKEKIEAMERAYHAHFKKAMG